MLSLFPGIETYFPPQLIFFFNLFKNSDVLIRTSQCRKLLAPKRQAKASQSKGTSLKKS
jgi:hypothetical protein